MAAEDVIMESGQLEDNLYDVEEEFATSWSDPNWFGQFPLHHNSIYDYFQNSPFYNNQCSNAIVISNQMGQFINFEESLKQLTGTEYKVDFDTKKKDATLNPIEYTSYNVIYEYNRISPKQAELQKIYYCPGKQNHPQFGSIFPMPTISMVFNNKLRNATWHLNQAMEKLKSKQDFIKVIQNRNSMYNVDKKKKKKKGKKRNKQKDDKDDKDDKDSKKDKEKEDTQRNQYSSLVDSLIFDMQKV